MSIKRPDGFEVYRERAGRMARATGAGWRWRLRRAGRIVADSGDAYVRKATAIRAARQIQAWLGRTWTDVDGILPIDVGGIRLRR